MAETESNGPLPPAPSLGPQESPSKCPIMLPLELQLMILSYIPLGLDNYNAAGWRDLERYLRVCKAWTVDMRKRIARTVPLEWLVERIRDVTIIDESVKQRIAYAKTLPKKDAMGELNEAAEYVAIGAFPQALWLLLDAGVSPDLDVASGPDRRTLLHLSISSNITRRVDHDRLRCVRLIVLAGANIEARCPVYGFNRVPDTPLGFAVTEGLRDIALELLHRGAKIAVTTGDRFRPISLLYCCALRGHSLLFPELLAHSGPGAVEDLVHDAILRSSFKVLELLLQHGFSLEESEQWKETPLETAVKAQNTQMVTKLVKLGADVCNRDLLAKALHFASLDMIRTLVDFKVPVTADVLKILAYKPWVAKFLLDYDSSIDSQSLMRQWLLEVGHSKVLQLCLKHGADPNSSIDGAPYLSLCIRERTLENCKDLLNAGAEPNPKVDQELMPLYIATECGFSSKVQLLRQHGATYSACPKAQLLESGEQKQVRRFQWWDS